LQSVKSWLYVTVSDWRMYTLKAVIGEPPVEGSCHWIVTDCEVTVVVTEVGVSGLWAARMAISVESAL
jgi:hypothetical protein